MQLTKENLKIHIIDDNEIDLELLETILRKMGFQNIVTSKSGEEAIQSAKEYQPHLLFIDIMLPGMSGGEFRELLKGHPETERASVIFISGIISKAEEKELGGRLKSGDVIIAKPFSKDRIAEAMVLSLKRVRENLVQ
jgi:CheY-like chemotaxis protein